MEPLLVSVGIGLLWGGSLVAVNRVLGERRTWTNVLLTVVFHVPLTMAAMYAALSIDASFMLTGVAALSTIALSLLRGNGTDFLIR